MADEELKIISSPLPVILTVENPSDDEEYEDYRIVLDNCEFVRRISVLSQMDVTRYMNGTANKPNQTPSIVVGGPNTDAPPPPPPTIPRDRDKKRRKVVVLIAVVTTVLLLMSVLLMVITIQLTPSIDERIRKEHEDLVRKMSEGIIRPLTNSSSSSISHDGVQEDLQTDSTGVH